MKIQFTAKNKALAEKFANHIKAERNLDSATTEKDGKFFVEYSIADYCEKTTSCEPCAPTMEDLSRLANFLFQEMQYQMNWLWAEIDWIANRLYKHESNGHLPPINGAEKMKKAIDVLGIGGDYEVQKPVIYASTRLGQSIEVDLSAKK
jgi:hypothetical protein